MKQWMRWSTISGATLCVACAPLQQAPLVYSSKVIVGVDVSANATESPGASVNIGVKSVDAAYVPIAVSKAIDSNAKRTDEATLAIERIYAEYGEGDFDKSAQAGTDANKAKIVAYLDAWKHLNEVQAQFDTARVSYEQAKAKLDQLNSLRGSIAEAQKAPSIGVAASAPANTDGSAIVDALNKRASNLGAEIPALTITNGTTNFDDVLKKLDSLIDKTAAYVNTQKRSLNTVQQALSDAKKLADDRFTAAAQAARLISTKKRDALSVYGRFDSNGSASATTGDTSTAPATNGSVLVGKVFSTGLASQNLTEAVMIEARAKCVTSALQLASSLKEDAEKKAFLAKLDDLCTKRGQEANR
jgi:hypothetical protein